jgi:PmbA protein
VDGRKASTELTDFDDEAVRRGVHELFRDAATAPQDTANAVSSGQHARIEHGPQEGDPAVLADAVRELLDFRARETPKMGIDEGFASHTLARSHTVTSSGSEIACSLGFHALSVFGTAREGKQASSFNFAAGLSHDLAGAPATERFGIDAMMRDTERQITTRPMGERFVGDVVLTPRAVADLLSWLHGQIGDLQLIAGTSLYRHQVGARIASPLLTLTSRFDAPGVAAMSADASSRRRSRSCARRAEDAHAEPVRQPQDRLAARAHRRRRLGARGGHDAARAARRGRGARGRRRRAVDGRPRPTAISRRDQEQLRVDDGVVGPALSETMISGNIAQMLHDVVA